MPAVNLQLARRALRRGGASAPSAGGGAARGLPVGVAPGQAAPQVEAGSLLKYGGGNKRRGR